MAGNQPLNAGLNQAGGAQPGEPQKGEIGTAVAALAFDLAPFLFLGLAFLLSWNAFFLVIALLGFVTSPIIGIILGVMAICRGIKQIGRKGMTLAVIAVALPVLAVLIIILLFSSGAAVISLM